MGCIMKVGTKVKIACNPPATFADRTGVIVEDLSDVDETFAKWYRVQLDGDGYTLPFREDELEVAE